MPDIISGNSLMLFIKDNNNYTAIAYAKSHELEIDSDTADVHSRLHGKWTDLEIISGSWTITCEALYTEDAEKLFDIFEQQKVLVCMFGLASNYTEDGIDGTNYSWAIANGYRGRAYITNLEINSESGEAATFTVQLEGTTPIRKVNVNDEEDYVEPAAPSLANPEISFTQSQGTTSTNNNTGYYQLREYTELVNPHGLPIRFIVDRYDGRLSE